MLRLLIYVMILLSMLVPVSAQDNETVDFQPADCAIEMPADVPIDCGELVVPLDHTRPDEQQVRLAVAIVRYEGSDPQEDPIVYLEGGPGGHALLRLSQEYDRFAPLVDTGRDVIIFDQRGAGLSEPAFDCPEYNEAVQTVQGMSEEAIPEVLNNAYRDCLERLSTTYNPDHFGLRASAADVEALRQGLGYEQINLFGSSYGTHLAQQVMRDYPGSIRSVVLDSTVAPEIDDLLDANASLLNQYDHLFKVCEQDAACRSYYPNLREVFYETVSQLNETPAVIQLPHPAGGNPIERKITDGQFARIVRSQFTMPDAIEKLPALIQATRDGMYQPLSDLLQQGSEGSGPPAISIGLALMLNCRVDYYFTSQRALRAATGAYPEMDLLGGAVNAAQQLEAVCGALESSPPAAEIGVPIRSDIPALILAGAFDGQTPPSQAMAVSENLYRGTFVLLPTLGHTQAMRHSCPAGITQAFYAQPLEKPDTTCIRQMQLTFDEPYQVQDDS